MMTTTDEFHLWIVASLRTVCRVFGSCRTSGATFSADQCAAADGSFMGHLSDKPVLRPVGIASWDSSLDSEAGASVNMGLRLLG
jgi:hypothetical protein